MLSDHGRPHDFFQGWADYRSGDESPPVGSRDGSQQQIVKIMHI